MIATDINAEKLAELQGTDGTVTCVFVHVSLTGLLITKEQELCAIVIKLTLAVVDDPGGIWDKCPLPPTELQG